MIQKFRRTLVDVTDKVKIGNPDDELVSVYKCVCGAEFDYWNFTISIYPDSPCVCDECGRMLVFRSTVRVFEVIEEPDDDGN